MIVESILSQKGGDVVCMAADSGVKDAIALLCEKGIGALVVTDATGAVAGVFSERDVLRGINGVGADILDKTIGELMTTDVQTVTRRDTADRLMNLMTDRRIRHLPVVEDGRLIGLVSIGDVVKNKIAETEQEAEDLRSYITS